MNLETICKVPIVNLTGINFVTINCVGTEVHHEQIKDFAYVQEAYENRMFWPIVPEPFIAVNYPVANQVV